MINYLKDMLSGSNNASSKRFVLILAAGLLIASFVASTFFGKPVDTNILSVIEWVIIASFGGTVVEKFANTKGNKGGDTPS